MNFETIRAGILAGFELDHLWAQTMGMAPGDSKERPLRLLAEVLDRERVPYALIGGLAVQIRTVEPRTTLDIDVAVPRFSDVPAEALVAAGFKHTGRHGHSDNWRAPGEGPAIAMTAVQFSAEDVGIADAIARAETAILADGVRLRVATAADLVVLKLAAAAEPGRRPSKRQHDVADVVALLELHPELRSPETLAQLRDVRLSLLDAGFGG